MLSELGELQCQAVTRRMESYPNLLSQPLTSLRGPASKVWATNVPGVKQLESSKTAPTFFQFFCFQNKTLRLLFSGIATMHIVNFPTKRASVLCKH